MRKIFSEHDSILVLDAGPLIGGINPNILNDLCYTTNAVVNEVKNKQSRRKLETILYGSQLRIIEPSDISVSIVEDIASKTGDLKSLSDQDLGILALSYQLLKEFQDDTGMDLENIPLRLLTDDYSLQNVATKCKIKAKSYRSQGIKGYIQWETYCPSCYRMYDSSKFGSECLTCGDVLKRRKKKKQRKR